MTAKFHGLGGGRPHAGGLATQAADELERLRRALAELGRGDAEVLEIRAFVTGVVTEQEVAAQLAEGLPADRPVLTVVRVYELEHGAVLGLEAISVSPGDRVSAGEAHGFPLALRIGEFVVARATPTVVGDLVATTAAGMLQLRAGLANCGADPRDVVKYNIFYRGDGTADDWAHSARARAELFTGPGPATTGIPVPSLADDSADIQFTMLGRVGGRTRNGAATVRPDGHWDWPIPLPHFHGNRVQDLGFVGGQVSLAEDASVIHPDDHRAQTRRAMRYVERILMELQRDLGDLTRLTVFYEAGAADTPRAIREELLARLPDRAAPELSLVGLEKLAYEHMVIEIEAQFTAVDRP